MGRVWTKLQKVKRVVERSLVLVDAESMRVDETKQALLGHAVGLRVPLSTIRVHVPVTAVLGLPYTRIG